MMILQRSKHVIGFNGLIQYDCVNTIVVHLLVDYYKIRNNQITIEHNFTKYSFSYMFPPNGVIIRLVFGTLLLICSQNQHYVDPPRIETRS
jgi:hypothetical protein